MNKEREPQEKKRRTRMKNVVSDTSSSDSNVNNQSEVEEGRSLNPTRQRSVKGDESSDSEESRYALAGDDSDAQEQERDENDPQTAYDEHDDSDAQEQVREDNAPQTPYDDQDEQSMQEAIEEDESMNAEEAEEDNNCFSHNDDGCSERQPLRDAIRRAKRQREGSTDEEDIPLAELGKRLKLRNARLKHLLP